MTSAQLRCSSAGVVEELTEGAVRRASAMFTWSPRPWLNYLF